MSDALNDIEISYSTTAYVQTTAKQLDVITENVNCWASGDENICTTVEAIHNAVEIDDTIQIKDIDIKWWLKSVLNSTTNAGISDIIFHK
ncbi:hypothetical protein KAR91_05660 [Candidatus Pacearchaeota archaeon]|nr:hypothetical protein [Candidatus Pacearchaeota archaeon]